MTITPGSRLGPYEVVAPIGAGGMGEVWRATDTRLERSVAIKILPVGFAANEQARARFDREARTISSLNHPHICTLFDVGHEQGVHYLVMELLEGESLADRIERGPLPPDQVLKFGAQIADALDRAHRQGIVHRDLKPGNVMITKSGAKLLDFGLARTAAATAAVQGATEMPTQAKPLTQEGTILGTFQYMAPEQLEGLEADARTDIFAFGALLYEMATGKRAFHGTSRTSLISAIVSSQPPPISSVAPMAPPALDHVVRKCLEKDPEDRWQSAHDVAGELRWISEAGSQAGIATTVSVRRKTRERLAWAVAAALAAGLIAAVAMLILRPEPDRAPIESAMMVPIGLRVATSDSIALSPDGKRVVFILNEYQGGPVSLWIRPLASTSFRQLAGTEGALRPFWSPDSQMIGFFAAGKLKTVDPDGGAVRVLCDARANAGGSWGPAGVILFTSGPGQPIFSVNVSGGTPEQVTKLRAGDTEHREPFFLADGKTFLFVAERDPRTKSVLCQTSLDRPDEIREVLAGYSPASWVEPGILLYLSEPRLIAQRYDAAKAKLIGKPVVIADFFIAHSASNDGKLLLQRSPPLVLSELVWVDRSGADLGRVGQPGLYFSPAISRDGSRFAVDVSVAATGSGDLWIFDVARNAGTRLTYEPGNESAPQWSAGDRTIVYFSAATALGDLYQASAGGTGKAKVLVADAREKRPTFVSADGGRILFNSRAAAENYDIWTWSAADGKAVPWLATPFDEQGAQLSPDGKWIAYQSNESGRWEVYVRGFPESDRKWLISSGGGVMPVWRRDGREVFYVSLDGKMNAVAVTSGATFAAAAPVVLFDAPLRAHQTTQYDVTPDGRRFLLNRRVDAPAIEPVALLQNWDQRLE